MKNKHAALLYKSTDLLKSTEPQDAKAMLLNCLDELINSIGVFHKNVIPNPNNFRKKSSSFSRALTILYILQSSIDFEKHLSIAKNLFQIYEYTRVALINEFKSCKLDKSQTAVNALKEIRDSWREVKDV